jgi:cysteine-rich repeat protein
MSVSARSRVWAAIGLLLAVIVIAIAIATIWFWRPSVLRAQLGSCEEVLRWKFDSVSIDGGFVGTTPDSVGSYTGTLQDSYTTSVLSSGCAPLAGSNFGCLSFVGDGTGKGVKTTMPSRPGNWTISMWIYSTKTSWTDPPAGTGCVDKGGQYTLAEWGDDGPLFSVNATGYLAMTPGMSLNYPITKSSDARWHHVAYVWDGTFSTLYVDQGNGGSSVTYSTAPSSGGSTFNVAFGTCNTGWYGRLDDVRLFDRALSSDQIAELADGNDPSTCSGGGGGGGGSPVCGNGATEGSEQCDDGNSSNTDACLNTCVSATCGDGYIRSGSEDCDDQNSDNSDSCLSCVAARCGDGYLRTNVEQCDQGNQNGGVSCSLACTIPQGGGGGGGGGASSSKTSKSSSFQFTSASSTSSSKPSSCTIVPKTVNGKTTYSFVCPSSSSSSSTSSISTSSSSSSSGVRVGHCCDVRTGTYWGLITPRDCIVKSPDVSMQFGSVQRACARIRYCDFAEHNCFLPLDARNSLQCTAAVVDKQSLSPSHVLCPPSMSL